MSPRQVSLFLRAVQDLRQRLQSRETRHRGKTRALSLCRSRARNRIAAFTVAADIQCRGPAATEGQFWVYLMRTNKDERMASEHVRYLISKDA